MRNWLLIGVFTLLATTVSAQNPVSVVQWKTTAVDTDSGNKSAGTIRVVIATDQIALTNALKVDGSAVTQPVSGTVTVTDGAGALNVICDSGCGSGVQYTQDAALTVATTVGTMAMGRASAAAPTDVSADGDAVIPWYLRSGALVHQPTFAGVLAVAGNGASGTGVQRVTVANDSTGILAGVTTVGTVTTVTNPVTVTDGAGALNVIVDSGTVTTVSTVTTLSQLGGVAVPVEDAAETAGGTGIYAMSVRRDTAASSAGASGDNATLNTDATGNLWVTGTAIEDAAETAGGQLLMAGSVRRDVAATSAGATADNATINTDALGLLWTRHLDPCDGVAKVPVSINIVTATTTVLVAASASNKLYVCSIMLMAGAADSVALVEDATGSCASPDAGMSGGTTAATGWVIAANSGFAFGNGGATVAKTASTNVNVCLITSAAVQLSGTMMYVLAP